VNTATTSFNSITAQMNEMS